MYIYVDGFYDCFNKSYFVYVYDLRFFLNLEKKIIVNLIRKKRYWLEYCNVFIIKNIIKFNVLFMLIIL